MKITFDSRSVNEGFARSAVSAFILPLDPTVEEMSDLKTAVSEAVTNCIVHGYENRIGTINISVHIFDGRRVRVVIRDSGCGIENVEQAMQPLFTTVHTGERSGLGFTVMQSFTDKIKVRSKPGKGTSVTLEKNIRSRGL